MNELGKISAAEHFKLGKKAAEVADIIYFVGDHDAEHFWKGVGSVANRESQVAKDTFLSARTCGKHLQRILKRGDLVLFKGSQGNVYLEEAIKQVLESSLDNQYLCRQSEKWMRDKEAYFDSIKAKRVII